MRCSLSYFIELKGGQSRVNRLAVQQYDKVVILRTVAALCTRSVLAFLNIALERSFDGVFDELNAICLCRYVCRVTHIARVWINQVRLPILLAVS